MISKIRHRLFFFPTGAILLFALIMSSSTAPGQWTRDVSANTPVCTAPGNQTGVKVVADDSCGAIFAWNDSRNGNSNVYLQRLDRHGLPQWTPNGIPLFTQTATQSLLEVFSDGAGGAITAWIDHRSGSPVVYAQRTNRAGIGLWMPGGTSIVAASSATLAINQVGELFVSWVNAGDIYAQKLSLQGAIQWTVGGVVLCNESTTQNSPFIAADGMGGAIVAWFDGRIPRGSIFAQALTSSGSIKWPNNGALVDSAGTPVTISPLWGVGADSMGNAAVVYGSMYLNLGTTVHCVRMNPSGLREWGPIGIEYGFAGSVTGVKSDGDAGVIVCSSFSHARGSPTTAVVQHINATGGLAWTTSAYYGLFPNSVSESQGGEIVVYTGNSAGPDVFSRHINVNGTSDWPNDLPVASPGRVSGYNTVGCTNGLNGVIVAWTDNRNSNTDIYAQNVVGITVPRNDFSVSDGCGDFKMLTFGQHPLASDGIDPILGESLLPPVPPTGVFDARFILPNSQPSWKDFRNDSLSSVTWRVNFQPGSCGYPITFTWDTVTLTGGSYYLKDNSGGLVSVNMKKQSQYTLTNSEVISLRILYSREISRRSYYVPNWNLASVPVQAESMTADILFPYKTPTVSAFGYDQGYYVADTLLPGRGYWVYMTSYNYCLFVGARIDTPDVAVKEGWNIIGPFDIDIPVSTITSTPPGIIQSSFWGFNGSYFEATQLLGGQGYWVKVSQGGVLHLGGSANKLAMGPGKPQIRAHLQFTDQLGQSSNLYLAKAEEIVGPQELPPLPPQGVMDVRYSSNTQVEPFEKRSHEIQISSAVYPLRLRASSLSGLMLRVRYSINGSICSQDVKDGGEVAISNPPQWLAIEIVETTSQIPVEFKLAQNYPNPFNPATTIAYDLPRDSRVSLKVFNLLGQEVASLVNEQQKAGYKSVVWNGSASASGIYYCRLQADDFVAVRKMLLLK